MINISPWNKRAKILLHCQMFYRFNWTPG